MTVYKLEVTAEDVEIIGRALDERPYREVHSIALRLQEQITNQDVAALKAKIAAHEAAAVEKALAVAKADQNFASVPDAQPSKTNGICPPEGVAEALS